MNPADRQQREQALDVRQNVLVRAPAGSGKTALLVQRCLAALSVARRPEAVLAITFTVAAANEIRQRLHAAIASARGPRPDDDHAAATWDLARHVLKRDHVMGWRLIDNPNRLQAMTIDALNARLVRQLPVLSGLGGGSAVATNARPQYEQAVRSLFGEYERESLEPRVRDAIEVVLEFADNNVDRLVPMFSAMLGQREQWRDLLRIDANAETDDSHVLSALIEQRLQHAFDLIPQAGHDLAGLFTCSTANEVERWAPDLARWPAPEIECLDQWQGLARAVLTQKGTWRRKLTVREGFGRDNPATADANDALTALQNDEAGDRLAARLTAITALPRPDVPEHAERLREALSITLSRCLAHLLVAFTQEGCVDFSEIAMRAESSLRDSHDAHWAVLERQDMLIEHLLVDEFQDTSVLQNELLSHLVSGWSGDDGRSLFLVGDPQQSIYGFRQAEVREFMRIWDTQSFSGLSLTCLALTQNFRSHPAVVDACNDVLMSGFPMESDQDAGVVAMTPSHAMKGPATDTGLTVACMDGDEWGREADYVCDLVEAFLHDRDTGELGILVRAKRHVHGIIAALVRRGLPHASHDLDALSSGEAAGDAIALIRALWHAADRGAWVRLLRCPYVGLSHADLVALCAGHLSVPIIRRIRDDDALDQCSNEGRARIARLTKAIDEAEADPRLNHRLDRLCESIWLALDGPATVSNVGARDVRRVFDTLRAHSVGGQIDSLERFMSDLDSQYAQGRQARVQIMTIHKAKGLEFDTVVLPGAGRATARADRPLLHRVRTREGILTVPRPPRAMDDGDNARVLYEFAHSMANTAADNERMRLLYVAMTRACRRLVMIVNLCGDSPQRHSLATSVWPKLADYQVGAVATARDNDTDRDLWIPRVPRLPCGWSAPDCAPSIVAPHRDRFAPSEQVVKVGFAGADIDIMGDAARIAGVLFHRVMQTRAAADRPLAFDPWSLRSPLTAMARREGLAEPDVAGVVERVIAMLVTTTSSSELESRFFAAGMIRRAEYHYSGFSDGAWHNGIIDLVVHHSSASGSPIWTLDYKTHALRSDVDADLIAQQMTIHYEGQLEAYVKALHQLYPDACVGSALYAPAIDRVIVVHQPEMSPTVA